MSIEKSLVPIREAHQKVLATTAALKGEIERLSYPLSWSWPEVRARLKSRGLPDAGSHRVQEEALPGVIHQQPCSLPPTSRKSRVWQGKGGLLMTWSWGNCQSWSKGLPPSLEDQQRIQRKRDPLLNCQYGIFANG